VVCAIADEQRRSAGQRKRRLRPRNTMRLFCQAAPATSAPLQLTQLTKATFV
jgi:hypothetical protein